MPQLQKPPYVFMNGRLTPWDEARIHVGAEALVRGISVFEGLKAYWRHDGEELNILAAREHYDRLGRSARLQQLPFATSYQEFLEACTSLARRLMTAEQDLWLRPTLFAVEGHWGEGTVTDLVITSYHQEKKRPAPVDVGIIDSAAARARRMSEWGWSRSPWSLVYECTVTMCPFTMPKLSLRTLTNGARQLVVHDAQLMTRSVSGLNWSLLIPTTKVPSISPLPGALMITRSAPAFKWADAASLVRNKPVHSSTTSAPSSFHFSFDGSRSAETGIR